jgi:non-heme chloroperoxidase
VNDVRWDRKRTRLTTGVELAYREHGHPGGQPLVMLHGFTDSSYSFSRLLPLLDEDRYHAYAIDQRGHGDSDKPRCCYSMDDFAADVVAFLDAVGVSRATVVAHSMGTMVARRVVEKYPDRVDRVVLIASSLTFRNDDTTALQTEVQALDDPVPEEFARAFQESTMDGGVPADFFDQVVAESLKVPAHVWRGTLDGLLDSNDEAQLASIHAPVLVIWGEHDPYFGRAQQDRLVAAIPGARLLVYPDTAHNPHWEHPESVAYDLSAFLRQTFGSEAR